MFVELHARSAFSFLEGASVPEELAEVCADLGMGAMALLDRDGVYGAPRFYLAAKRLGLKAHIGSEITLSSRPTALSRREDRAIEPSRHRAIDKNRSPDHQITGSPDDLAFGNRQSAFPTQSAIVNRQSEIRLPVLAESREGYQNLCRLVTRMKLRAPKHAKPGEVAAGEDELRQHASGLVCLTGDEHGPLAAALARGGLDEAQRAVERLVSIFGQQNVYVELQRHFHREQEARNHAAIAIARRLGLPLLATNGVHHARPEQRQLQDMLTCVREHCTLDTAGRLLARNHERHIKSPDEMARLFADLPEAIAHTAELSARLQFTMKDLGYQFPRYPVPDGETMMSFLRSRVEEGARDRYGGAGRELRNRAHRQIERELSLIEKLDLAGYFLIVWDIVRYCGEQRILVQGRGSAANSAVCYSLGITAVDPVKMELLFERFLSEERGEWPDIDLDLPSGDQRERVIQHVYQRYGQLGAAMTANVITYRGRSAAREMGKALGFDGETLNRLSSLVGSWEYKDPSDTMERQFRDAGFDLRHPRMRKYLELCLAVQDLPRHLGQHSGGMVICQGQLDSVVPLEPATMPGRVVVQWDKEDCADMGIIKVDLLGLGMMAVLEESLELIEHHSKEKVDLAHLPSDDPEVYGALQKADTVGMFQIESRAQMSCLPRLRPQKFYDIVVQVAIIRPGPIVGKMVHPYLQRRQGREPVVYPHPALETVLGRTLGVPLFQEQLLRMAMITAGFTGGEAEELRRALGFKRSEKRMREIEIKLRAGMSRNGITGRQQDDIVQSITAFALYGFPESHSASFALLAYASAFLKVHHLAAFTAALLNNQPMGFYHPSTIVKDAQRHGLKIKPVDVMRSEWKCTLEEKDDCRLPDDDCGSQLSALSYRQPPMERARPRARLFEEAFPTNADLRDQISVDRKSQITDQNFSVPPCLSGETASSNLKRETRNLKPLLRLGFRYVRGMREEAAQALVRERAKQPFSSITDLAQRVPELRKNELVALAEIGALNSIGARGPASSQEVSRFTFQVSRNAGIEHLPANNDLRSDFDHNRKSQITNHKSDHSAFGNRHSAFAPDGRWPTTDGRKRQPSLHRRDALWQVEKAVRMPGPLLQEIAEPDTPSPLATMTAEERLVADFRGTGLTTGPHPMQYHREAMRARGVMRACDLPHLQNGKFTRVAGCVIARQRPGTAKGFVFLSLEDETGIANAIITPDIFDQNRLLLVAEKFLLIEGVLQNLDNVISVKARRVLPLRLTDAQTSSHDFH